MLRRLAAGVAAASRGPGLLAAWAPREGLARTQGGLRFMNRNHRKPRRGNGGKRAVSNYMRKQKAKSHRRPAYKKP